MNRSSRIARSVSSFLTSPNKVAHTLEWKKRSGSVLGMFITRDRIDIALTSHPAYRERIAHVKPIALERHRNGTRNVLDDTVAQELQDIIRTYNVCGMIVGWPLEREGWCGASCGRVLHTLDELASTTSGENDVISESRPLCLYDMNHYTPDEDEWGRSPVYCETTGEHVHISHEKHSDEWGSKSSSAAETLLKDFCETFWPDHEVNGNNGKISPRTYYSNIEDVVGSINSMQDSFRAA